MCYKAAPARPLSGRMKVEHRDLRPRKGVELESPSAPTQ